MRKNEHKKSFKKKTHGHNKRNLLIYKHTRSYLYIILKKKTKIREHFQSTKSIFVNQKNPNVKYSKF